LSAQDYREEEKLGRGYDSELMKRLLKYLKPYRWHLVIATLLLLIGAAVQLVPPYLLKVAIDSYITKGNPNGLDSIALIFLAALGIEFFVAYFQFYIMQWIGQKAMLDLRREVFAHVQKMHLAFFDRNPSGRLLTRITNDVNALNELFASGVVAILGNLAQVVGIIAMMFYISIKLTLATFIILPLLIGATAVFRKRVREAYRRVRVILARLNAYTQDNLAGISEVQYFTAENSVRDRFETINDDLRQAHQKSILYYAVFFPAVEVIGSLSLALILWYGGGLVIQQAATLGTLAAFIQYAEMFYRPVRDLADKYNILQSAMAASERIFKLLDTPPEITAPTVTKVLNGFKGQIEFEKVNLAYNPDEYVLHDINFRIKPGEKVALVGATGAGKSSVVSLMCRFYNYQKGSVRFDDVDITEADPANIRAQIGLVLQDVFLFSGTIRDNISLGTESITTEKVKTAAAQVGLLPYLNELPDGLEHQVGERGGLLSVGQRQLISFARALAHDPRVIILDEATSSVDNHTEQVIQQALKRLFAGRTSVIVAHRLSTIKEADKILVFHKGRIVEEGRHDELLKARGVYWRLYQLQYQDQEVVRKA
jgi:ATP-binding cassette subfamily B multidrug efflux pump